MTIKYVDAFKANDGSLYIRLNPRTFWGKICIRLLQKRAYFCKRYTWACSCWPSFPNAGLGTDGIDVWWPGIYYLLNVRGLLFIFIGTKSNFRNAEFLYFWKNGWANVQREDVNSTTKAWGVTERGTVCHFEMRLGMTFEKGSAGIAPTHGGFLMCGRLLASSDPTLKKGVFTVR